MKARQNTTLEDRAAMVVLVKNVGKIKAEVARLFKVDWDTVNNAIKRKRETGLHKDKPRSGKPKVTTTQVDKYIRSYITEEQKTNRIRYTCRSCHYSDHPPFFWTVKNRLLSFSLRSCVAKRNPLLRHANIQKRLVWTRQHKNFTQEQ